MGGKARWRKLQRVVGCLPQGPHGPDKQRQRRERARTRDAKRRRLGDEGEEESGTILIGKKKEKTKEEEKQNNCEEKKEGDEGTEEPHHQQEKETRDEAMTQPNDVSKGSSEDENVQEAVEHRAGVWTASPSGWVFRPQSDTTLEEELRKAQEEEEEENGRKDQVADNGQRIAKFFLSDDESDSDTAIFIDVYQPVLTENKDLQPSGTPVTASPSHKETQPDGLMENSLGLPAQSQVQVPQEAEGVESGSADAMEKDEISETMDPLAKISTMEAVVSDCPPHDTHRGDPSVQFSEADAALDLVGTDRSSESAESSVNGQSLSIDKVDEASSSGLRKDATNYTKSEWTDETVEDSTAAVKASKESDASHGKAHPEVDFESHPTSREQVTPPVCSEVVAEAPHWPESGFCDTFGKEDQDAQDTICSGDSETENIFFSLYPEYHPSEADESESQDAGNGATTSCDDKHSCSLSLSETQQDGEGSMCTAAQKVDVQGEIGHPKDIQGVCDGPHTTSLDCDVSCDASPPKVLDPAAAPSPEIKSSMTICQPGNLHHELLQAESFASQLDELEESGTEAGQDALELESKLEMERSRQTLVGKAREWIKGVARMGGTRRGESSYGKPPILEAKEKNSSLETGKTQSDTEILSALTDTMDTNPAEAQVDLSSTEDVKVDFMLDGDQEDCFTPVEDIEDIRVSGEDPCAQQTPPENVSIHSTLKWNSWSSSHPDRSVPEEDTSIENLKDEDTKGHTELPQDPEDNEGESYISNEEANVTKDPVQHLLTTEDVAEHYLQDENMCYYSAVQEESETPSPSKDAEDHTTTTGDRDVHARSTKALHSSHPLPDTVVFSSTLEDSHDITTPAEHLSTHVKPETSPSFDEGAELHYVPEEEMKTPHTPTEGINIFCSSGELLQAHYTPEGDSVVHDTPDQEVKADYIPENYARIHEGPTIEKDIHCKPDDRDFEQYYTPVDSETNESLTEEHSTCHTPGEEQQTCVSREEENLNPTPTGEEKCPNKPSEEPNIYESVEEPENHYTAEEKQEQETHYKPEVVVQMSDHTPVEEEEVHSLPEEGESRDHYKPVEEERACCTLREEQKSDHTPVEEEWPHHTPADEQNTCYTPTEEMNGFSTPAEDEDVSRTPEKESDTHKISEEELTDYTPDEGTFTGDDQEQKTHNLPDTTPNTGYYTPTDEWESCYTPVMEADIISTPAEEKAPPSTTAEEGENAVTPRDHNTPVTCAHYTPVVEDLKCDQPINNHESDFTTRYIPDSRLEGHYTPVEENAEEQQNEEGDEKAEKKLEEEENSEEERNEGMKGNTDKRKEREIEGKRDTEMEEMRDSEGEEKRDSEREGRRENEREETRDNQREETRDSEREGSGGSEREGRKDREGERRRDKEREGRREREREGRREREREGRRYSEREERRESEREERRKDIEEGKRENEREKRRPSDWEWRRTSGGEGRADSDNGRRRNSEGKGKDSKMEGKESKVEGNTKGQTPTQAASPTLVQGQEQLEGDAAEGEPMSCGTKSHGPAEEMDVFGAAVPWDALEEVNLENTTPVTEQKGVPQRDLQTRGARSARDFKPHQKHGKARQQLKDHTDGDSTGKAAAEDESLDDARRERKGGNKRRRNRRNRGTNQGEQETSVPQSQSAIGRNQTTSQTANIKSNLSHGSPWEMAVPLEKDIHYQSREYLTQRQREPRSPRESLTSYGASAKSHKSSDDSAAASGTCKKPIKNVPYQKRQHQVTLKNTCSDSHIREGRRRVERFSEEQKAAGAGEFAASGSLGMTGSKGTRSGERRRWKGYEKESGKGEREGEILQEKFSSGEGAESVGMSALSKVWSPRIERKERKEHKKERRERKVSEKSEDVKKAEIKSPREELSGASGQDRNGASQSQPLISDTPLDGVPVSLAQNWQVRPPGKVSPGSLLGAAPPPVPPRAMTKLRFPEALLQPLSPPPSPPLHKARDVKKTKTTPGETEKIGQVSLTPDASSYAKTGASQSFMYTIPEAAHVTPHQTEQDASKQLQRQQVLDQPQYPPKPLSFKDTSDSPEHSQPPCLQGKQTHGSSSSNPPPSCDTLHLGTQPSNLTSSSSDPQPGDKEKASTPHPFSSLLSSSSAQESVGLPIATPTTKPHLKPKPNLTELKALQKAESVEKISTSNPMTGDGEARPLGSPGKVTVAQRIKFPESPPSLAETRTDTSKGGATSYKPDLQQARSVAAASLPLESEEGDAAAASLRHTSPTASTTSAHKTPSKVLKATEASPRTPSPLPTVSSSPCTDTVECAALRTSEKPLQKTVSSPRPRRSNVVKSTVSESVGEAKLDTKCAVEQTESQRQGKFPHSQTSSQLAEEDRTASTANAPQHPQEEAYSFPQRAFTSPKEGSQPRSRDFKMKKKRRR